MTSKEVSTNSTISPKAQRGKGESGGYNFDLAMLSKRCIQDALGFAFQALHKIHPK